ncbi:hypothetical protein [Clostridium sp. B9]|uniref:hypothetical protein n=1 Tax=Clostridium sp. B9 TaxID=3423224 RepID=UPI003D2E9E5B
MSKVVKGLLAGIFVSLSLGGLVGCASSQANESVAKGKELINSKNYCKALVSFEMALDEDPENEEAKDLKNMLENYLSAEKAFKEGNVGKAEVKISAIGDKDKNFKVFHESVLSLEDGIEKKAQYEKDINSDMDKLEKLINNKSYEKAQILCKSISSRELNESQKETFDKLRLRLGAEIKFELNKDDKESSNIKQENTSIKIIE